MHSLTEKEGEKKREMQGFSPFWIIIKKKNKTIQAKNYDPRFFKELGKSCGIKFGQSIHLTFQIKNSENPVNYGMNLIIEDFIEVKTIYRVLLYYIVLL